MPLKPITKLTQAQIKTENPPKKAKIDWKENIPK
ncbi:MAG: hypothetical protein MRECE_34c002 [Mycoplasmataceae bacterium CE_OT135]|nr:MAG: hypothetical protein MRECE_34c002 [Mycoplasmataceae bacterium CE_OT135]